MSGTIRPSAPAAAAARQNSASPSAITGLAYVIGTIGTSTCLRIPAITSSALRVVMPAASDRLAAR